MTSLTRKSKGFPKVVGKNSINVIEIHNINCENNALIRFVC